VTLPRVVARQRASRIIARCLATSRVVAQQREMPRQGISGNARQRAVCEQALPLSAENLPIRSVANLPLIVDVHLKQKVALTFSLRGLVNLLCFFVAASRGYALVLCSE